MAMEWNIIGDVHGDYDALMRLIKIMPDVGCMSVGDMIDRGPKSLETMQFFMREGNKAILGNHEHMMVQSLKKWSCYSKGLWFIKENGGFKTVASMKLIRFDLMLLDAIRYNKETTLEKLEDLFKKSIKDFPKGLLRWLSSLPLSYEEAGGLFVTHAPYEPGYYDPQVGITLDVIIKRIWNVNPSKRRESFFHVHGHHRVEQPDWHKDDEGIYGINLDTGRGNMLTGIHWPSMKIFSVQKGV